MTRIDESKYAHREWLDNPVTKVPGKFKQKSFLLLVVLTILYGTMAIFMEAIAIPAPASDTNITKASLETIPFGSSLKLAINAFFTLLIGFVASVWWTGESKEQHRTMSALQIENSYRRELQEFQTLFSHISNSLTNLTTLRNAEASNETLRTVRFLIETIITDYRGKFKDKTDAIWDLGFDHRKFVLEKANINTEIKQLTEIIVKKFPQEVGKDLQQQFHAALNQGLGSETEDEPTLDYEKDVKEEKGCGIGE